MTLDRVSHTFMPPLSDQYKWYSPEGKKDNISCQSVLATLSLSPSLFLSNNSLFFLSRETNPASMFWAILNDSH